MVEEGKKKLKQIQEKGWGHVQAGEQVPEWLEALMDEHAGIEPGEDEGFIHNFPSVGFANHCKFQALVLQDKTSQMY